MRDLAIIVIHLVTTITRLTRPGGARAVVAESLLVKHQLVVLNRGRERAPYLRPMDRVIGFAVHAGALHEPAVCRMFNGIIAGRREPRYLSSDNNPLSKVHQWKASLRILDIEEIRTVPHAPLSHPFVERLVGSVRRELLGQTPFWNARDLERKLRAFADYCDESRVHHALSELPPESKADDQDRTVARLDDYRWQTHCRGLYQLPVAA